MLVRNIYFILLILMLTGCEESEPFSIEDYLIGNGYEKKDSSCSSCDSWIEFTDEQRAITYLADANNIFDATYEVQGNYIYIYEKNSRRRLLSLIFINKDLLRHSWLRDEWNRMYGRPGR